MGSEKINKNKMKIWLELGLAILLVAGIGIGSNSGAFERKIEQKRTEQASSKGAYEKAEAENAAAKAENNEETEDKDKQDAKQTEEVIAQGQYPIMGKSPVTVDQMVKFFKSSGKQYPAKELQEGGADNIETFCQMFYDEAAAEGVRPEVAFVQTMKETGFLQYGGDASIRQFNFAGLGTTGGGVPGESFADVRIGIRAQIQHLKAYATGDALNQECVDDRYEYVTKGCAPYVEWLGQKENPGGYGWATAERYGYSIVDMIAKLKTLN
ncbi:glucosaminidase domain-containing protein [Clostridium sp. C105KSO13]|uniref:glucosaminidase domain-containing protein n=1 Tax=Clostridium sp. C105KSO13 TaxID=1776045 RepID=UPI00074089A6|nr:glucosaminidase domain-containing protein [Clostridium sp. C105KSO13]CUX35954.1 Mannosyl-glycoprotein endo-beta-N-acetylglucosaminidase [Clostridium sp. C105KSO13]